MNIFDRFIQLIKKMFGFDQDYAVEEVENMDDIAIKPHRIYLEIRGGKERWLHLACPSGCGDLISVNLMKSVSPYWVVSRTSNQKLTLSPSINKTDGCKSHFFIRDSKIVWAG